LCSYCGCEAEPAIALLMDDHAWIASRAVGAKKHLDAGDVDRAFECATDIQVAFARHARMEERGLFIQLQEAGEAVEEVMDLLVDHRNILAGFSAAAGTQDPNLLRRVLDYLMTHAQTEDNDLFPFAIQRLPDEKWSRIEDVHQASLMKR
jgi:hemerythrin-like domain-containing protein